MRLNISMSRVFNALCLLVMTVQLFAQAADRNETTGGLSGMSGRGNHVIRGKIILPSGQSPELRMRVVLELVSGGIFGETFSDTVGGFEFRSLPNNTYRVVINSDGQKYEKAEETLEVLGTGSRTFISQLYLREKDNDNRRVSSSKMISAAEFMQDVPKSAKKHYELGVKKLKDRKPDEAMASFQDAVKIFPDYVQALNKVSEYQASNQRFDEAEANLKHAAEVSPKFPLTQINLGLLMVQMKRYSEAVHYLDVANKLDESYPICHLNLGIALLERTPSQEKDLDRAEQEFNKTLAMGGTEYVVAHKYLFNIYVRRHDYGHAISELEAYLKDAPNAPDIAQVQEMLNKVKKAAQNQTTKPQ